jgi:transcriptional regulator with XRE-family HTH domain
MGLSEARARQLGEIVTAARMRNGISVRRLAKELGLSYSWLAKFEAGVFTDPAPDRLAIIAERLGIDPARVDRLTTGAMSDGLPEPRVYFRAKLELTQDQADQVERYIARLRRAA